MDWKYEAMAELREYEARRTAVENLPDDIAQLEAEAMRLGGASGDSSPVKGGSSAWEDKQINLIVKREKLQQSLECARKWVEKVEKGLAVLSKEERLILDRFYINPAKGNLDRLCYELGIEKTAVYNRRLAALRHYTQARFGCTEI